MVAIHFYMSNTMTIMTDWNKVRYQTIFPVSINMMHDKHPFIFISTVVTFFIINFPRVLSITTRHLSINRFFIPIFKSACIFTKFCASFMFCNYIWLNIKNTFAFFACSFNFIFSFRLCGTKSRAIILRFFRGFFRNKFNFTCFASVCNGWLSFKNSTTCITARIISFFMLLINNEVFIADGAYFINHFHKGIIS